MDVDSIAPGADFVQNIQEAITSCGVVLALIGHDWLVRGNDGRRLLDDPQDFIRLELSIALAERVPIIPILVERTPMPSSDDLPEELRPLSRIQASELENGRWDFDVARLVGAVEPLVAMSPAAPPEQPPSPPRTSVNKLRGRLVAGGALVIVLAMLLYLFLGRSTSISLSGSFAGISPDALAEKMVRAPFTPDELPAGVSLPTVRLESDRYIGLVARVRATFPGKDASDIAFFDVVDSADHARAVFPGIIGYLGFDETGTFDAKGISGTVRCITQHRGAGPAGPEQVNAACGVLNENVILQVITSERTSTGSGNKDLTVLLLKGAIRHALHAIAAARSAPPRAASFNGKTLLGTSFDAAEIPAEVAGGNLASIDVSAEGVTGLASRISATFTSVARQDYQDFVFYSVFDSNADAKAWFDINLVPFPKRSVFVAGLDSSGFAEPAYCKALHLPAAGATDPERGISACFVVVNNVVIESFTSLLSNTQAGNTSVAVTLARAALIHLDRISTPASSK